MPQEQRTPRYQTKANQYLNSTSRSRVPAVIKPENISTTSLEAHTTSTQKVAAPATEPLPKMSAANTRPQVLRAATLEETRLLMRIIESNAYGLKNSFYWEDIAGASGHGYKTSSASTAFTSYKDLKVSLNTAAPTVQQDLEGKSLEELDKMMEEHTKVGKKIERERTLKREMKMEAEELEQRERELAERRETLRRRTEERLGMEREEVEPEHGGDGDASSEDEDEDGSDSVESSSSEEDVKIKVEKLEPIDD